MPERDHLYRDIDRQLEDAVRARQQLDAQRWREQLRPCAMRIFAARTAKLPCSRAALKLLIEELYPDDLFTELVGNLDRVPLRRWPQIVAIAVALRHSWRRDGLARIAKRLHVSLNTAVARTTNHTNDNRRPSRRRLFGSPQACQGFPLAPTPFGAGGLDNLAIEPKDRSYVMAGRQNGRSRKDRTMRDMFSTTTNIDVTIGGQLRIYLAYLTDADPSLDGPSTITLDASTLTDLSWLAADPIVFDNAWGKRPARLVLVESPQRKWHRDSYRGAHCIFAPADPMLVSLKTLQDRLWRRLQASPAIEAHA